MSFECWVKEADKDLEKAIRKNIHNKSMWESNTHKNMLLPYYLQYRMFRVTWWLALATWALAIATIILVAIQLTIF